MLIQTILKKTLQYKGFSFGRAKFGKGRRGTPSIEVEIFPKKSNQPICSGCGKFFRVYDHLKERLIEHIPFWGFSVFFCYSMRRVDCPRCGVVVERVPWVNGKHHLSRGYSWYLSGWCKRLSIQEAADAFRTTWYYVFCALEMAVEWGRANMDLTGIRSLGIDEILWRRGRKFLNMVYQIDNHRKRLLWVGEERTVVTIEGFFKWFGKKKFANTIYAHRSLILNWFKAKGTISSGAVEGLNNKAKISFRRAYGFRTFRIAEIVLYHSLGDLPEFEFTHKFF